MRSLASAKSVGIDFVGLQTNRDAVLLAELLSRLACALLLPVVENRQPPDIGLRRLLIFDQLGRAGDRDVLITTLDAEREARVTAQVEGLPAAGGRVHHDLVAIYVVPQHRLLRRPVGVDR